MSRSKCLECGANRGVASYNTHTWCFSCGHKQKIKSLFKESRKNHAIITKIGIESFLPTKAKEWLNQYYITDYKDITWSDSDQRILFSYEFNNNKIFWGRSIDRTPKWLYYGSSKLDFYLRRDKLTKNIVLVEDVISAKRINSYCDVIALGGTKINSSIISTILNYDNVILWLDGDPAGKLATEKIRKQLSLLKPVKIIKALKDPKCHSPKEMQYILDKYLEETK